MNTDEHEHKYLEEQKAMKEMDEWLEKTVKRMNGPKKKMKKTLACTKNSKLGGRRRKTFGGAEMWSHFIVEGHCSYAWRQYNEELPDKPPEFCHKGKHMEEHCAKCVFFTWTPSMLSKQKRKKIWKVIKEVMGDK